ncbi:hypothetical protein VF21_09682 [Pseudogymnoascus sp. 05NY08]|nr:hypothetical protein VF21_09682 [Pseudogymnoascus sp. 05NY08]
MKTTLRDDDEDADLLSDSAKSKEALLILKFAQGELTTLTHPTKKARAAKGKSRASGEGSSVAQNLVASVEDSPAPAPAPEASAVPGLAALDFNNPRVVAVYQAEAHAEHGGITIKALKAAAAAFYTAVDTALDAHDPELE